MRRLLSLLAAVLAATLFVTTPATATPSSGAADPVFDDQFCFFPGPQGWPRIDGPFDSCASCKQAGQAGVARGDWSQYHCGWFPAGLDVVYYIYVPPTPG